MATLDRAVDALSAAMASTSGYAPAILFLASFVEYVFPPFPGDMLVVLGAWYAVHGVLSWPATFAVVTAGAIAGAALDHAAGTWLGSRLGRSASAAGRLTAERLARFEAAYRRHGWFLLVANRFLPGVRAFLFVAAGAARIPVWKVLLLGAVSAMLWNALLLLSGAVLVKTLPELIALVSRTMAIAAAIVAAAVGILVARAMARRRRAAGAPR